MVQTAHQNNQHMMGNSSGAGIDHQMIGGQSGISIGG